MALTDGAPDVSVRLWHTPLLKFYNPLLESRYRAYFRSQFISVDLASSRVHTAIVAVFLVVLYSKNRTSTIYRPLEFYWAVLCNALLAIMHCAWMSTVPSSVSMRHRTVVVAAVRLLHMVLLAIGSGALLEVDPLMETTLSFWGKCVVCSGILSSIWLALAHPLLFKHHLLLQTIVLLVYMKVLPAGFCAHTLMSDEMLLGSSRAQLCTPDDPCHKPFSGLGQLTVLHNALTYTARLNSLSQCNLPSQSSAAAGNTVCISSLRFLQLALVGWLPTMVLYVWERRMRANFLLHMEIEDHEGRLSFEVERALDESRDLRDYLCRGIMGVMWVCQSLAVLLLAWYVVSPWH